MTEPVDSEPTRDGDELADLDRIAEDLADVELALQRIERGEYWSDELTGEAIDDAVLAALPTARRADAELPEPAADDERDGWCQAPSVTPTDGSAVEPAPDDAPPPAPDPFAGGSPGTGAGGEPTP